MSGHLQLSDRNGEIVFQTVRALIRSLGLHGHLGKFKRFHMTSDRIQQLNTKSKSEATRRILTKSDKIK